MKKNSFYITILITLPLAPYIRGEGTWFPKAKPRMIHQGEKNELQRPLFFSNCTRKRTKRGGSNAFKIQV